jgi:sporulation protein YlmC with PRC-barrel domain
MKLKHPLLGLTALLCSLAGFVSAQPAPEPGHPGLGQEKSELLFVHIKIKNHEDVTLGRIKDLGIDLINGRVVVVLVESDGALDVGKKVVALPPRALTADATDRTIYRLNTSVETFRSAAAIDLSKWEDFDRSDKVAATYRLFGQEPYFIENGVTSSTPESGPMVSLGHVERSNKLLEMPVGNHQGEAFGEVWSMTFNILQGRISSVIILAPGNFKTKSIVPAMALSFNDKRDALLLDDTKEEFADEPRYIHTPTAFGNDATSREEAYSGPRTNVALEQGSGHRDIGLTVGIYRGIRAAKINNRHVELATLNGRVTLRGWAYSADDRERMGAIAIARSTLELVDNQITVGRPVALN